MRKVTRILPSNYIMEPNSHGAETYREWCVAEVERMKGHGTIARLVEEWRVYNPFKQVVKPFTEGSQAWCRVDRV